jgi:stage II sporulation protein M
MYTYLKNIYLDNREWIRFAVKWFGFAMIVGAITFFVRPELIHDIADIFESKFGETPPQDTNLATEIFVQNATACAIALIGGLLFGISSFFTILLNGFIIGFVILTLYTIPGDPIRNIGIVTLGLIPHGIFEIPALMLASALGLRLGTEWLRRESEGRRWSVFGKNVERVIATIPLLALLLLIAAFVEVFVSGKFVDNYF